MADTYTVQFDQSHFKGIGQDHKVWQAAQKIVLELLQALALPVGTYRLRLYRKMRWQGNHVNIPYKVAPPQHGLVFLTIKPPGYGNDASFEYTLRSVSNDWDQIAVTERITAHIKQLETKYPDDDTEEPVVDTAPTGPVPAAAPVAAATVDTAKLSISEKVAQLEQTAARNNTRHTRVAELQAQKLKLTRDIEAIRAKISALEMEELTVLEAIDNDQECLAAQAALSALGKILG